VNGLELDRRVMAALRGKWQLFGWSMETPAPDGVGTLGDMLDTTVVDCSLIFNGLVPVDNYEEPADG
jgi:hypothetical protein